MSWLAKIRSDWPKMGQIGDYLRSVIVHCGTGILKSPRFVQFCDNLDLSEANIDIQTY